MDIFYHFYLKRKYWYFCFCKYVNVTTVKYLIKFLNEKEEFILSTVFEKPSAKLVLVISMISVLILSMGFPKSIEAATDMDELPSNPTYAQLVDLNKQALKTFDYDADAHTYQFDIEQAAADTGVAIERVAELDLFMQNATPQQMLDLKRSQSDFQTFAIPAIPVILAAIVIYVGYEVANAFIADIYNYGMTKACQNFSDYDAIEDFCSVSGYI